jgi:hypothetical protein|tara:strand:+ start:250 stop:456 length:207 start_codon:yes stop_codon:yes gene_type:complete
MLYIEWSGGHSITTAGPIGGSDFVEQFHEMLEVYGRPEIVEYRDPDEEYYDEGDDYEDSNDHYSSFDY